MKINLSYLFVCICFLGTNYSVAQSPSSAQPFSDEEKALLSNNQLFEFYSLIGVHQPENYKITEYQKQFYAFLDELNINTIPQPYDKADAVFKALQENYLLHYEEKALFIEMFTAQQFSSVTGSALYALSLTYLNIPYQINANPQHVFVTAYPGETEVILDCTLDQENSSDFVYRKTNNYKQFLLANALIDEAEANDAHFRDNHFLIDTILDVKQLAAIPYYHHFVKHFEKAEWDYALMELEKAVHLYEAPYMMQWLKLHLSTVVLDKANKYDAELYCDYLLKHQYHNWDIEDINQQVIDLAAERAQTLLALSNGDSLMKQYLFCLKDKIEDADLVRRMDKTINLQLAQSFYLNQNYDKTLNYLHQAYELGDTQLHQYIQNSLVKKFKVIEQPEQGLDSLRKYESIFPFAKNNRDLKAYKAYYLMKNVYGYFKIEDIEKGLSYLEAFRTQFQPADEALYRQQAIASGFAAAVYFYAAKQNYAIARQMVSEGLQYVPGDAELLSMQQLLGK